MISTILAQNTANKSPRTKAEPILSQTLTVFTDREAAVEELEFLVAETGAAHVIVPERDGRANRWQVVPASEAGDRTPLVICTPPWRPEVANV